jgi:FGGY-family pentulose kinase
MEGAEEEPMADGPYLLGIDFGTGGARVGIFDAAGGPQGFSSVEFATTHPRAGWAEQDPNEWWSALVQATRGALEESGVSADDIVGISLDGTSATVVAADADGNALRPALLWMDVRAADQADRIANTAHPALKYNGYGAVSAEWGLPKAMWIKENEPDTWNSAVHVADEVDWVSARLTGEWAGNINSAASKFYHDRDEGGFPTDLFDQVGVPDLMDKYPTDIKDLGVVVGGLKADVAQELGLKEGTPVAAGGIDAYMGQLGLGVVEPGKIALITGSSHVMLGQAAKPIHGKGFWGSYTDALVPGQYTVEAGQVSTGSVVAWFKNNFGGAANAEAEKRGVDPYVILNEMAEKVAPGSEGLLVLDYFQGNRSPYTDPLARGQISGLSLVHGAGHVFRAILEGICYGTEHIFRALRDNGFEPRVNVVSGGPTKSELWMQLHADISNVPIAFTKVGEGPVLGSAMLAAVGAGIHSDLKEASDKMVHTDRTIEPNQERHEQYQFYVDRYIEMYPKVKDEMHALVRHEASQTKA